jgi:hypothetical protein
MKTADPGIFSREPKKLERERIQRPVAVKKFMTSAPQDMLSCGLRIVVFV